jgi:hypothetical protein
MNVARLRATIPIKRISNAILNGILHLCVKVRAGWGSNNGHFEPGGGLVRPVSILRSPSLVVTNDQKLDFS